MKDYKEMYFKLFNDVTKVIEDLKIAQINCEDIFCNEKDNETIK